MKGHALTLNLLGSYLRDAYGGDIRKRDRVQLAEADAKEQGGHAFRTMDSYVRWLENAGESGALALAMLRLMGLFDRPADAGCLHALWRAPAIEGLTELLLELSEERCNLTLTGLAGAKLLTVNHDAGGALVALDAHPLLRDYFAKHLRETRPAAWTAAHKRIFEHLVTTAPDKPEPTLDELQPLYQAIAHGCHAGLQQEACEKVYRDRILRGTGTDGFYSSRKLGAFGADLGAVACFFDPPWRRVSPKLSTLAQAWLLGVAAYNLRGLGRLTEALEPNWAGRDMAFKQVHWTNAASCASNLSELELTLGEVAAALRDGKTAVTYADRSGDAFLRMAFRATLADALHQAGRRAEAAARFLEVEAMQAELWPAYRLLFSLRGFQYCDLLLGDAERAAWRRLILGSNTSEVPPSASGATAACAAVVERARQTLAWRMQFNLLLDIGLDHLTLARAALCRAILRAEPPAGEHVKDALDVLRRAGAQHHIPRALLTRALFRSASQNFDGARADLDEAFEIAGRGPMRLFLADIHLHRARLFGLVPDWPDVYPWASPRADLDTARTLIESYGYGRRREELEDAEAAWRRVYGGG